MKQNFGLDGSSVDLRIGKGKVGPDSSISFAFIVKKRIFQDFLDLKK